jgi:hypothetical protein
VVTLTLMMCFMASWLRGLISPISTLVWPSRWGALEERFPTPLG